MAILDSRPTQDFSPVSTIHCRHKYKNMAASGLTSAEHRLWTISSSKCTGNRYSFFHLIRPKGCQKEASPALVWLAHYCPRTLCIFIFSIDTSSWNICNRFAMFILNCYDILVSTLAHGNTTRDSQFVRTDGRDSTWCLNHLHLWSLYSSPIYSSHISTSLHHPYQSSLPLLPRSSLSHPPPAASWAFLLFATASSSPSLYCSLSSSSTS